MEGIHVNLLLALLGGDLAFLGNALVEVLRGVNVLSERTLKDNLSTSIGDYANYDYKQ